MAGLFGPSWGSERAAPTTKRDSQGFLDPFNTTSQTKDQSRLPSMSGDAVASQKSSGSTTTVSKTEKASTPAAATATPAKSNPFDEAFSLVAGSMRSATAADRANVTRNMTDQTLDERQAALDKVNGKGTMASKPVTTSRVTEEQPALPPVPAYVEEEIAPSRQVNGGMSAGPTASSSVRGGIAPGVSLSMTGQAGPSMQQQIDDAARVTSPSGRTMQEQIDAADRMTQKSNFDQYGNPVASSGIAPGMSTREAALNGSLPSVMDAPSPTAAAPSVSAWDNGQPLGIGPAANQPGGISTREAALNGSLPGGFSDLAPSTRSDDKTSGRSSKSSDRAATAERTTQGRSATSSAATRDVATASAQGSGERFGSAVQTSDGRTGTLAAPGLAVTDNSGQFTSTGSNNQGGGGCYITTAAMHGAEADDGPTLTALRRFRDTIMAPRDDWRADIATYYATAPAIVAKIEADHRREKVYAIIRHRVLAPCLAKIAAGDYTGAHRLYQRMVDFLGRAHLGG